MSSNENNDNNLNEENENENENNNQNEENNQVVSSSTLLESYFYEVRTLTFYFTSFTSFSFLLKT